MNDDETNAGSLRKSFGLAPLRSEKNAPPVDMKLINEMLCNPKINDEQLRFGLEQVRKYSEWREEFCRQTIEMENPNPKLDSPDIA